MAVPRDDHDGARRPPGAPARGRCRRDPTASAGGLVTASLAAVEPEYDDGAFESLIAPLAQTAQDALRLRFVEDLDYDRIAVELGTSPEAARQRVSTAVRTLRQRVPA